MLIIASDLHLSDGTCAKTIAAETFQLFTDRIRELAFNASWDKDDDYQPIQNIDLVLMGDVFDPLHSTLWLDLQSGSEDYIRPWSEPNLPRYAAKLQKVTRAIIQENATGLSMLRRLGGGEIVELPPAVMHRPDFNAKERISPQVRIYYMIGNHDWYYHLPGPAFDAIRKEICDAAGLSNPVNMFPWKPEEYEPLREIFAHYRVYAHHGDMYDYFNFDREKGRDMASLGDVFGMEVLNRFPEEVEKKLGTEIPAGIMDCLRKLTNIRPALATPLWISGQIRHHAGNPALENILKKIWDDLGDEFLQVDFVRQADKAFQFDIVDAMELIVKISKRTSFNNISDLVIWLRDKMGASELSYASHALREPAFLNGNAHYVVYGHTHHHEIIPLDMAAQEGQIYFNSGTWHSYYDLAIKDPKEEKFVPYQTMTYLAFYQEHERGERNFEAWSGIFA
jgi:UDP-2,3-diacylglucosamine pyrophosphatase LpxH